MAPELPKTVRQWAVTGTNGLDNLKFSEQALPELGDNQVLVKLHAASLNYRDIAIPTGNYPFPVTPNVIPGSDGAGTVVAVGKHVGRFKVGDRVATLFNQRHLGGPIDVPAVSSGLGGALPGVFRSAGAFDENGLVHLPESLSFAEGATLPCAALTAWNALYGLTDHAIRPGQWVLTQGTGGVSIFAVQFAKAAGARVIATTSSAEKAALLKRLGADHIINYAENPGWGAKAKELTGGEGVHHVIEVAGPKSIEQSFQAIRLDGVISVIGFVGGTKNEKEPGFLQTLYHLCTVRGILVGNRVQMEDMLSAIDSNPDQLRPVIDSKRFKLEELREAYEYLQSAKHQGKIVVDIE